VIASGADGAAVISAVVGQPDIISSVRSMKDQIALARGSVKS